MWHLQIRNEVELEKGSFINLLKAAIIFFVNLWIAKVITIFQKINFSMLNGTCIFVAILCSRKDLQGVLKVYKIE